MRPARASINTSYDFGLQRRELLQFDPLSIYQRTLANAVVDPKANSRPISLETSVSEKSPNDHISTSRTKTYSFSTSHEIALRSAYYDQT
jgi:hypothetical protein